MHRFTRAAVGGAVATAATLVMVPAPALAASNSCTVPARSSYCSAGNTSANAQHEVFVEVSNVSVAYRLKVRDVVNGAIIHDQAYSTGLWRRFSNVYSTYEADIICNAYCPGTVVRIFN